MCRCNPVEGAETNSSLQSHVPKHVPITPTNIGNRTIFYTFDCFGRTVSFMSHYYYTGFRLVRLSRVGRESTNCVARVKTYASTWRKTRFVTTLLSPLHPLYFDFPTQNVATELKKGDTSADWTT